MKAQAGYLESIYITFPKTLDQKVKQVLSVTLLQKIKMM